MGEWSLQTDLITGVILKEFTNFSKCAVVGQLSQNQTGGFTNQSGQGAEDENGQNKRFRGSVQGIE